MSGLRPSLSEAGPIEREEKTPPSTSAEPIALIASENVIGTEGNASGWMPLVGGTEPGARETAIA